MKSQEILFYGLYFILNLKCSKADRFTKYGSRLPLQHPASQSEARSIINHQYKQLWTDQHSPSSNGPDAAAVTSKTCITFRLRMGHCQLQAYLYCLKLSHTQTANVKKQASRSPNSAPVIGRAKLEDKLWDLKHDLQRLNTLSGQ